MSLSIAFFKAPYEYFRGCKDIHGLGFCTEEGERCVTENQCSNCTFGKCIQLAKDKDSKGFSYSKKLDGTSHCKLCTIKQLGTLQKEHHWVVYKISGNLRLVCKSLHNV